MTRTDMAKVRPAGPPTYFCGKSCMLNVDEIDPRCLKYIGEIDP